MAILACPRVKLTEQDPMNFKEVHVGNRTLDCVKVRQCRLEVRLEEPVFDLLQFVKILNTVNVTQVAPGFVVPEWVEHA
jgi:hypothetical protein